MPTISPNLLLTVPLGSDLFLRTDFVHNWSDILDNNPGVFIGTTTSAPTFTSGGMTGRMYIQRDSGLLKYWGSDNVFHTVIAHDPLTDTQGAQITTQAGQITTLQARKPGITQKAPTASGGINQTGSGQNVPTNSKFIVGRQTITPTVSSLVMCSFKVSLQVDDTQPSPANGAAGTVNLSTGGSFTNTIGNGAVLSSQTTIRQLRHHSHGGNEQPTSGSAQPLVYLSFTEMLSLPLSVPTNVNVEVTVDSASILGVVVWDVEIVLTEIQVA